MQAVTKEVTFDCAHMLSGYAGLCRNLHGHTYKLQVSLTGPVADDTQMVVDFNELKQVIDQVVADLDHATIISGSTYRGVEEEAIRELLVSYKMKVFVLPTWCRSTCEDMAKYLHYVFSHAPRFDKFHVSIRLWETPTSFVEVDQ